MTRFFKYLDLERRTRLLAKNLNCDFTWGEKLREYVHELRRYGVLNKKYRELGKKRDYERV